MKTISFVSQKGGVGKTTLALATACEAAKSGLSVKMADLDTQQGTLSDLHRQRLNNGSFPIGSVEVFATVVISGAKPSQNHRFKTGQIVTRTNYPIHGQ